MRHDDSKASALWGKSGAAKLRRYTAAVTVIALALPANALAGSWGGSAESSLAPVFTWLANWTW